MNKIKELGKRMLKVKVKIILIASIIVFCAATIFATATNAYTVNIVCGDETMTISTMRTDANDILRQANIEVFKGDIVDLSDFSSGTRSTIKVYRACTITIYDDSNDGVKYPAVGTVEDSLKLNSIVLKDGDTLSCDKNELVKEGMEIVIARAFPVTVIADGETYKINISGGTVSDALDKAVVAVDDDDIISSPLDAQLEKNATIKIVRVTFKERAETAVLPFETKTTKNASLYTDQSKVTRKGVNGQQKITYKDKYVDGKLKESVQIKKEVLKAAVPQIKEVGTKKRPTVDSKGNKLASAMNTISYLKAPSNLTLNGNVPTSYKRKIVGTASAYSGGGVTATGRSVKPGYIAVNPNQIPYHTKMWIVSNDGRYCYGYSSAEDTGGFIYWSGNRSTVCDLYFASESAASAFGRRSVTIYIL